MMDWLRKSLIPKHYFPAIMNMIKIPVFPDNKLLFMLFKKS